jgi:hypothetical protein
VTSPAGQQQQQPGSSSQPRKPSKGVGHMPAYSAAVAAAAAAQRQSGTGLAAAAASAAAAAAAAAGTDAETAAREAAAAAAAQEEEEAAAAAAAAAAAEDDAEASGGAVAGPLSARGKRSATKKKQKQKKVPADGAAEQQQQDEDGAGSGDEHDKTEDEEGDPEAEYTVSAAAAAAAAAEYVAICWRIGTACCCRGLIGRKSSEWHIDCAAPQLALSRRFPCKYIMPMLLPDAVAAVAGACRLERCHVDISAAARLQPVEQGQQDVEQGGAAGASAALCCAAFNTGPKKGVRMDSVALRVCDLCCLNTILICLCAVCSSFCTLAWSHNFLWCCLQLPHYSNGQHLRKTEQI